MGNCCFDPSAQEEAFSVYTPLLKKAKRHTTDVPFVKSTPSSTGKVNGPTVVSGAIEPRRVSIKPVKVAHVDKRLSDHASRYNDHLQRHVSLRELMRELNDMLLESHDFSQTLLLDQCDTEAILHVRRTHQYCLHVTYDCGRIPESVLPVLLSFNRANKLIRELMDKAPPLVVSLELLVRDEKELRRDVLAANLDMEGPACMRTCVDNIVELRRTPDSVRDITADTIKIFQQLKTIATAIDPAYGR